MRTRRSPNSRPPAPAATAPSSSTAPRSAYHGPRQWLPGSDSGPFPVLFALAGRAVGKFGGGLAHLSALEHGAVAVQAALDPLDGQH
ncbi:hypothetical protein [Rhodococcus opacus]|uniref:hypothetical protein n=1 Tax=Rhodococcus opacus TaxID=37919 RepID=UPI002235AEC6|nr:hypothetical protein [Rhodococcus opacus]UZG60312.1 hypothetical protein ONE62_42345 [Rhodococcus opacus]